MDVHLGQRSEFRVHVMAPRQGAELARGIGGMTSFYFGPANRRLFGVYHPSQQKGDYAVLLCSPLGQEAVRAHRLYRVVAEQLARSGVSVLRFDAFGSGDSEGDDTDLTLAGWRQDIQAADAELRARCGAANVTWVGIRLGATMALAAAAGNQAPIQRLLLWDPVLDGPAYLRLLAEKQVDALKDWRLATNEPIHAGQVGDMPREALGFALSPVLIGELLRLTVDARFAYPSGPEIDVVGDESNQDLKSLVATIGQLGSIARFTAWAESIDWTTEEALNTALVPAAVRQQLMSLVLA